MARIVACSQCGAPHRLVDDQNRFQCDWCQVTSTVERDVAPRELVASRVPSLDEARLAVERELEARGVRRAKVRVEELRWIAFWHVVSETGEEFHGPADPEASNLERTLSVPALPLVERRSPGSPLQDTGLRPVLSASEAIAAALSSFRDRHSVVDSVRLIWLPVIDVMVRASGRRIPGLVVGSVDRVLLATLPEAASRSPLRADLLQAFGLFTLTAVILGVAIDDPVIRLLAEAIWLLVGWITWTRLHKPPRTGRSS